LSSSSSANNFRSGSYAVHRVQRTHARLSHSTNIPWELPD